MLSLKGKLTIFILILIYISCSNLGAKKRVKIKNYFVEANFENGKISDGVAKYYNANGKIVNTTLYEKAMRNGISINYYSNGVVSDSIEFVQDKENGFWNNYDSFGIILYSNYYYYGLLFGPELIYKGGKVNKFFFSNFNRDDIVECYYNSVGKLDSIAQFKMNFTVLDKVCDNRRVKNLFGYLPKVPNTFQNYAIGLTNKNKQDREMFPVQGHDFIIDTLLLPPPKGWYYYLACHLKADDNSINKVYIEEVADTSETK